MDTKSIVPDPVLHISTLRFLLLCCATSFQLVNSSQILNIPTVSVKASTSIVQSASNNNGHQLANIQPPNTGPYDANSGRQQRSLAVNNNQHAAPSYYLVEAQQPPNAQDIPQKFGSNEVKSEQAEPALRLGYLKLIPNSNFLSWQPGANHRSSVSSSWTSGTPTSAQHKQQSQNNQQNATPPLSQTRLTPSQVESGKPKILDVHCQRKSLTRTLRSAKNLLTDKLASLEQYATTGNIMLLGSSLLAGAIPLAALVLPSEDVAHRRRAGSTNEQSSSLFGLSRFGSLQARVDSAMSWMERSVEHLPSFPRLHPQECVKRSICEAHNDPDKFGAIGFILRLLFPATNLSNTDRMDNMDFKVINKYRHAAGFGLNKRLDNNGSSTACKERYEDCLVSLLDVAQNLTNMFLK